MTIYQDAQHHVDDADAALAQLDQLIQANPALVSLKGASVAAGLSVDAITRQLALITPKPLMPLVSGLFVEGSHSPVPQVTNTMCNPKWSDLQTSAGGALVHPNPIDTWLQKGLPGHCRLFFGPGSPAFALAMGKVVMHDPTDNKTVTVANWWQADVMDAQADLVSRLAAAYDGKLSLIFMATPMGLYAEPMIRDIQDAQTRKNLLTAGYTTARDKVAFARMLDTFSVFKQTRLGLAFNPYQTVNPDGGSGVDVDYTIGFMDTFRGRFGEQAHVQNNSIRTPLLPGKYTAMYDHMRGLKPSGYQTATEARVGDFQHTVEWAISQGAHSVELSPGFNQHLSAGQLSALDQALKANA